MTIETRDFGTVEISEEGILELKLPILGFESQRRFVILYDDDMGDSLAWLQSVTDKDVCFIIMDPRSLLPAYSPDPGEEALAQLDLTKGQPVFRCLIVIPERLSEATINLKSPLVINPEKRIAGQVILEENYPVRALLRSIGEGMSC